ncbi:MAG TPA: phosphodiester glycosidase family protein [Tepidisphaeraceae bacterium]|nr:phosphodiester glycosidase family protein [Tepidisphaeraceae bacterium]
MKVKPIRAALLLSAVILLTGMHCSAAADQRVPLDSGVVRVDFSWQQHHFTAIEVDLRQAHLRLFWKARDGTRFGTFDRLKAELKRSGERLVFATNAGIFEPGFTPTGLHVEDGHERVPLNRREGAGNFYLKPNGVFFVDSSARIVETAKYPGTAASIRLATQSGPLLVRDGKINQQFDRHSRNTRIRSGVGISGPQHVWFVLSNEPVTFFQLASVFGEKLDCRNALYFDGAISKFYPPVEQTGGVQSEFAGIFAVVAGK